MRNALIKGFTVAALAAGISACGGSDSGSSTGTMSLGLTDAPVGDLTEVRLNITAVEVKPADGERVRIELEEALDINLLDFQGGVVANLFQGEEFPAGQYEWIRLRLGDDPYVKEDDSTPDTEVDLFLPSGRQTGLKLNGGFIIPAGGAADFTLDFDVRKSIVETGDNKGAQGFKYILKPTHRLVDNVNAGSINGNVDYGTINQGAKFEACDDTSAGSAYIYAGNVPADELTDLNSDNLDTEDGPLMVVPVKNEDEDGNILTLYNYTAAFLPAGDYTVSYSCQADDNEKVDTLEFIGTQPVTVVADEIATAKDIPLQ